MVYVKEYIIDEYGTHLLTGKSVINRKDIDSDYYSPLLHQNGGERLLAFFHILEHSPLSKHWWQAQKKHPLPTSQMSIRG